MAASWMFRRILSSCSSRHLDEGVHDEDAHLGGAWAIKHVGSHDGTVLSEGGREVLDILPAFQGHNL